MNHTHACQELETSAESNEERFLALKQAAKFIESFGLKCSAATLDRLRKDGAGPEYFQLRPGSPIFYKESGLRKFILQKR